MNKLIFDGAKNQYLYSKKKKYLDFCMSNGAMILGHSNKTFLKSVNFQKNLGSNYSFANIQNEKYQKEIKKIFKEYENIHFCNSGSEANIRALRVIRTATNKKKIAMINGSWHGSVDNFMFDLNLKNKIFETGGLSFQKNDVIMLKYNDIEYSLNLLKKNRKNLAGLILEPIQASCPTKISEKYLYDIFKYCKKNNILVIFDEIITGFRTLEGSVQNKFAIKPDITILGKVSGGGLPIGLIGINNAIFKKIKKNKIRVFFGGTFSANSMSSFVGYQTLMY